jgi:hypothetical protein
VIGSNSFSIGEKITGITENSKYSRTCKLLNSDFEQGYVVKIIIKNMILAPPICRETSL